ncbi:hypothetical protein IFO70_20090 [Phormidium tenue FACHB-886]|nr:hypothetical protein [Phormidium tenue FACHB-886]
MVDNTGHNDETMSEEVAQNPGMRAAAINSDPTISLEEARNASAGEGPTASGGPAPSSTEEEDYVASRSDPYPSSIPSTDHPLPDDDEDEDETVGSSNSFSDETDNRYAH